MTDPIVPKGGGEESASFDALPVGFYDLEVHEVSAGYSKGAGDPYVLWIYVVLNEEFKGSQVWHRTSMKEKAKTFPGDGFYAVLNRLGLSDTFAGREISFEEMCEELSKIAPGLPVKASLVQYIYEGQVRNEVTEFFKADGRPEHKTFPEQNVKLPEGAGGAAVAADPEGATPASPRPRRGGTGSSAPATSEAPY